MTGERSPTEHLGDAQRAAALTAALAGRYDIERELGRGGMATVYLARDVRHKRPVALKVLDPELSQSLGAERFLREIELAANLQHPHIVPVHDSGEAAGLLYYVMPFVDGETLRARLARDGPLGVDEVLRFTREVAEALDYAHEQGVVHRDVKPENVLLSRGHALVADFGVARAVTKATDGTARATLTQTGLTVGTPAYMSPEQAVGGADVDGRADQYALACVAFELLAGVPAFTGSSAEMVARRFSGPPPSLTMRRPDLPAAADTVLRRALALTPADRFTTATTFVDALRGALGAGARSFRSSGTATGTPGQDWRRMGRRGKVATGVAGALLVGATYWLVAHRPRTDDAQAGGAVATRPRVRPTAIVGASSASVAVLPLATVGADTANTYFADGMTDALITAVAKVPGIRVTPRASAFALKGVRLSTRQVGETLHVATVLEGSVQRAGERLRVAVQLTDPTHDSTLWSDTYDGSLVDVFGVQDKIARAVVGALRNRLAGRAGEPPATPPVGSLVRRPTGSLEAYDLYLKGRALQHTQTVNGLRASLDYYQRALAKDSAFALAYAGLADTYWLLGDSWRPGKEMYSLTKAAALRALALDSTLAEAHIGMAWSQMADWDFPAAEREFRRAAALDPTRALPDGGLAYHGYAFALAGMSRMAEAVAAAEAGYRLDPLSAEAGVSFLVNLFWAEDYERLITEARHQLELNPANEAAADLLGLGYAWQGRQSEAQTAIASVPCSEGFWCAMQAVAYARLGARAEAERRLAQLLAWRRTRYLDPSMIARIYAALGEKDAAFEWLERAYPLRSSALIPLRVDPMVAPLRGDPRFASFVARLRPRR